MKDIDFLIARKILQIGNLLRHSRDDNLKTYHITNSQWEALHFFDEKEGSSIFKLKEHLKISHQAAQKLVEHLKQKELLTVCVSKTDAREKMVYLTGQGKDIILKYGKSRHRIGHNLLKNLTEDEKEVLMQLLEKLNCPAIRKK